MRALKYISVVAVFVLLIVYFRKEPEPYQILSGQTMGTYYNIKIRTEAENLQLYNVVKNELSEINKQMSVFDPDSEISKINKAPANEWIDLSPEMSLVLKTAYQTFKKSGGTFDPTVGQLIDLWGFGIKKPRKIPADDVIAENLKLSGFNKISFNEDFSKLKKSNPQVAINLSAIAKGYGVDRVAQALKNAGYNDFVVEIGGEVAAFGQKSPDVKGWNVGIVKPTGNYSENAYIIPLKDTAIATSGNYRNYFYMDGKKFSHTISPKTGRPIESSLISVTVLAKNCMEADALTTAMMAMGDTKAIEFANRNKIAAVFFLHNQDDTLKTVISNKAKNYIRK